MKKPLLTFTLLFVIGMLVNKTQAQTSLELGIRAGVNFASFSDSKQEVDSRRIGFMAGAYAVVPISKTSFSIQPEILYTQKGAEINEVEIHFSYIEIPLLVRVNLASKRQLKPHLYLGPSVSFNLDAEEDPPAQGNIPLAEERANNVVYGLAVGGGTNINRINIGLRYNYDFKEAFDLQDAKHSAISIVLGYQF